MLRVTAGAVAAGVLPVRSGEVQTPDALFRELSSARDQVRYARFHLGYPAMQRDPGPGGTLSMEVDGVCVTWWQRRTAEGVPVFTHLGSWGGQNAELLIVPARAFAMSILTNSTSGPMVIADVDRSGWALTRFAELHNPPAVPTALSALALSLYEGHYQAWTVPPDGSPKKLEPLTVELRADGGGLRATGDVELALASIGATTSLQPKRRACPNAAISSAARTAA
jgi:hypothetical protein